MKKTLIIALSLLLFSTQAFADQYVSGYTRRDGTYVQGYTRSSPDSTVTNNYSFKGNTNPYTGSVGSNRYQNDTTSPYYSGHDSRGKSGHSNYGSNSYGGYGSRDAYNPYGR